MELTTADHSPLSKVRRVLKSQRFWFALVFLIPALIWVWLFVYSLLINAFPLAFQKYNILNPDMNRFIGWRNYRELFRLDYFVQSITNTLLWFVYAYAYMMPITFLLALLISSLKRGRNLFQGIFFVPCVVSLVAMSLLFQMILDPYTGQVNQLLRLFGVARQPFLTSTKTALPVLAGVAVWKAAGFYIILMTAGIMSVPVELHEAAIMDGAGVWSRTFRITIPLMVRTLVLITIMMTIGSLQEMVWPLLTTGGGPGRATWLYNMTIYSKAFNELKFGVASAAAVLLFFVILIVTVIQYTAVKPDWEY